MAKIRARATSDFCPPESWFISRISARLPLNDTRIPTPVNESTVMGRAGSCGDRHNTHIIGGNMHSYELIYVEEQI